MIRVIGLAPSFATIAVFLGALATGLPNTARGAAVQSNGLAHASDEPGKAETVEVSARPEVFPFKPSTPVIVHSVTPAQATAQTSERLIYQNTLGVYVAGFPSNLLVADDIATTAPVGCKLTRYRFTVTGKVNPAATGGAFTVRYALYDNCPQSATSTQRSKYTDEGGIRIRGADGQVTFPDEAPRVIEHVVDAQNPVAIPTNLWLGVIFSRTNCGVALGAPAMIGHSADNWDFPGLSCYGNFGGFPEQPHASFIVEMFGGDDCPESFVGYKAARASSAQFNAGLHVPFLDDVKLVVNDCQMVGYEVALRGEGFYNIQLERECTGGMTGSGIPGTYRSFIINFSTQPQLQLARFTFDPPIPLNASEVYFRFDIGSPSAGVVMAGVAPSVGSSRDDYFVVNSEGACEPKLPVPPVGGVFHASITCAGPPPSGACCDPYLTECSGGADDGKRCKANGDCVAPGTCEAVCREVPQMNCPFPPHSLDLDPKWVPGAACTPDPFTPLGTPCGVAACCRIQIDEQGEEQEVCINESRTQCETALPLNRPREWQLGAYCGEGSQVCPRNPCIGRKGGCFEAHSTPGCCDPYCCASVCTTHGTLGTYCCVIEWDLTCVDLAGMDCSSPAENDTCAPILTWSCPSGANLIPVPGSASTDNRTALPNPWNPYSDEPGFCCHGGVSACVGGENAGKPCVRNSDCPGSSCPELTPMPGASGYGSVWFKFTQPQGFTSASISTCTNAPALDSLLQVFKAYDHSSLASECASLVPIGCNDDTPGCSSSSRNSKLCLQHLVPGETYYIMLAAKTPQYMGPYRVTVSAGCTGGDHYPNDYCPNAIPVLDGATLFNLNGATFDCPAEPCVPDTLNDLWYDYTATCTGWAVFHTCADPWEMSANASLVVYDDCEKCPPVSGPPVGGCEDDNGCFWGASLGSRVLIQVEAGHCYKVRISDKSIFPVAGFLNIACEPHCPDGLVEFVDPPDGVVDARRPHAPNDPLAPEGIAILRVTGPTGISSDCWSFCETKAAGSANAVADVAESTPGRYSITLLRPITPGAVTTLTYTDGLGIATTGRFTYHPANVNGDGLAGPGDILDLIDGLNGLPTLPWGLYSGDLDHSGQIAPADILEEIDLLNGAGGYTAWNATALPTTAGLCP